MNTITEQSNVYTSKPSCRGLIILIFDSLRKDFLSICSAHGISTLPAFDRLRQLAHPLLQMRCGSFPTVPMRTDLLTGQLAFLHRRWAQPIDTDPVFTRNASRNGIQTTLITDNYIMTTPKLGASLHDFFDDYILIRGSGSDLWQDITARNIATSSRRPVRSPVFEQQFIANVEAWECAGGTPWYRLFREAERILNQNMSNKGKHFILWVDCFSTHEPWVLPDQLKDRNFPEDEPISPPYDYVTAYTTRQLSSLRRQYSKRIAVVDEAMDSFSQLIENTLVSGDVALVVLSDHGFLFGEYGIVGKPTKSPVLPPLHDLVCWLSPHFKDLVDNNSLLQPHDLTMLFCEVLGISFPRRPLIRIWPNRPQLIGRNSPTVRTITLATTEGFVLVFHDDIGHLPRWYQWSNIDELKSWEVQGEAEIPSAALPLIPLQKMLGQKPWAANFKESFKCVKGMVL